MNSDVRLPISLRIADKLVVVVGGGEVGRRKASSLAAAGARVSIVDPRSRPDGVDPGWTWVRASFAPSHLDGASLVVAAATIAVNALVVAAARERGLWVADAISPECGDLHFPAVGRRGRLTLTVETGGASPSLAARLREDWLATLEADFPAWLDLLFEYRLEVRRELEDATIRQELTAEFARDYWRRVFTRDGVAAVRAAMAERLREAQLRPK